MYNLKEDSLKILKNLFHFKYLMRILYIYVLFF